MRGPALTDEAAGERDRSEARPLLTVVVPVYNQAGTIVENVRTIRERVERGVDGAVELIVVSDGSIDGSEERLLEDASHLARVIHYDRNLGKGFAVKAGSLAASGEYISYVDSDLDLDPAGIPAFLETARRERLDFVIGSKRHPDSQVHYPAARKVSSWLYQQLVRTLFRLDVRDTQVGLKVFRREVAEEVMPLLLVKQYAFDLELLAVARALGFDRLREMPVSLDYRFTGSGVRSIAVLYALVDTAAIFYRLRVLRYYQRRRELLEVADALRRAAAACDAALRPTRAPPQASSIRISRSSRWTTTPPTREARSGECERRGARLPRPRRHTRRQLARQHDPVPRPGRRRRGRRAHDEPRRRARARAGSRRGLGVASRRRLAPLPLHAGKPPLREEFPTDTVVVRREDFLELDARDVSEHRLAAALVARGKRVVYTPDTVVVRREAPLFRPHLEKVAELGAGRGRDVREGGCEHATPHACPVRARRVRRARVAARVRRQPRRIWLAGWALYGAVVATGSVSAGLRHRSAAVSGLTAAGAIATHMTYGAAFLRGLIRGA